VVREADWAKDGLFPVSTTYHLDPVCDYMSKHGRLFDVVSVTRDELLGLNTDDSPGFFACDCWAKTSLMSPSPLNEWLEARALLAGCYCLIEGVAESFSLMPYMDVPRQLDAKGKSRSAVQEMRLSVDKYEGPFRSLIVDALTELHELTESLEIDAAADALPMDFSLGESVVVSRIYPLDVPATGPFHQDSGRVSGTRVWSDIGRFELLGIIPGSFGDSGARTDSVLAFLRVPNSLVEDLGRDPSNGFHSGNQMFSPRIWQRVMPWSEGLTLDDIHVRLLKIQEYAASVQSPSLKNMGRFDQFMLASDLLMERV
jgi:hypothetical protein